jgi:hypothetical protein
MANTQRTNGNCGKTQRIELAKVINKNQVNYRNCNSDYVWEVSNLALFKEFISDRKNGKASAIARMKNCFLQYE